MITLFIDTSTTTLTVALIKDDNVLEESTVSSSEHSKHTMPEIEKLFKNNNIEPKSVNKIMVTNGPGSFTGIRIGVTIAKTYAWACNINIVPISTLKAYALSKTNFDYYIPMIDARRNCVYAGVYDKNYNEVKDLPYFVGSIGSGLQDEIDAEYEMVEYYLQKMIQRGEWTISNK